MRTTPHSVKNKILLISVIDDTFCSPESKRAIKFGDNLSRRITNHVKNHKDQYYGFINLEFPSATYSTVSPLSDVNPSRLINVTLNSNSLLNVSNEMTLPTQEGPRLFNGDELDFILPPKDFEIHIAGIDNKGYYKNILQELASKGYTVYLYENLAIKYRSTEAFLSQNSNELINYCNSGSVIYKK